LPWGPVVGAVLILRWFWWRINAWTEISALLTSIIITIVLEIIAWQQTIADGRSYALFNETPVLFGLPLQVHHKLMIIVPIAVIVWLTVTFLTKPEKDSTLVNFYKRVQPGGYWGQFGQETTLQPVTKGFFLNWIAGLAMIYGLNFAIGNWMFGSTGNALILFTVSGSGFWWIWKKLITQLDS